MWRADRAGLDHQILGAVALRPALPGQDGFDRAGQAVHGHPGPAGPHPGVEHVVASEYDLKIIHGKEVVV